MGILKNLQKSFKMHHMIGLLGVVILIVAIAQYSGRKGLISDGMTSGSSEAEASPQVGTGPVPANPAGDNEVYASVTETTTSSSGLAPSCTKQEDVDPSELLPKDNNTAFGQMNPSGDGPLANVSLLKAGHLAGIDTVGSSLRNANLQVRSEPPNPQSAVGPWNNTTIEPDLMRVPLELGCGANA